MTDKRRSPEPGGRRGHAARRRSARATPSTGAALEFGAAVVDGHGAPRRPGPHPAGDAQPARARRGRHRHRQDQDAAADGRAALRPGRPGLPRRHQGRPVRAWRPPASPATGSPPARPTSGRTWAGHGIPHRVPLARRPRAGHPHPRDDHVVRARRCWRRCSGSTTRRSPASAWSSTTPTRTAWRCSTSRTCGRSSRYLTSDEGKADLKALGGLSSATAGVILRELITFSDQGADAFFGEPEFDTSDLLRTAADGTRHRDLPGAAGRAGPAALFSTFLMWLLADLFHDLPEVGDLDKPKLVFFFDEAHLLFDDASKAFLDAIEQTVRLIRSKGVGVFFVTQTPEGRARRRAGPARQPRAARPARLHPRRREGAQGGGRRPTPPPATTSRSCSPRSARARPSSRCSPSGARRRPWRGPG